jgi:ribosomal-protein-alanine N-acetyltransferase
VNEPALVLRHAAVGDIQRVLQLEISCFASDPWPRQAFESFVDRAGVTFVVAEEPGAEQGVVGYAVLIRAADEAEILNLAVAPDRRRDGIGGSLLDSVVDSAVRDGVRTFYLEVRESNQAARRLYERHGFAAVGRRRGYYQRPSEDALILQKVAP